MRGKPPCIARVGQPRSLRSVAELASRWRTERRSSSRRAPRDAPSIVHCDDALGLRLHVILMCLHVLHVNVVTYVIFLLHTGEFTCKIIYM